MTLASQPRIRTRPLFAVMQLCPRPLTDVEHHDTNDEEIDQDPARTLHDERVSILATRGVES